jgi:hypothetical protein
VRTEAGYEKRQEKRAEGGKGLVLFVREEKRGRKNMSVQKRRKIVQEK